MIPVEPAATRPQSYAAAMAELDAALARLTEAKLEADYVLACHNDRTALLCTNTVLRRQVTTLEARNRELVAALAAERSRR